jgi:hypothetical protein
MNEETIKKRDELIAHFGSVEKYQAGMFDKIPPVFLMMCDAEGNVYIDRDSVGGYLKREMKEYSLTIEQLIERDKKTFGQLIDDYYTEVFA